jgi:hypothetical protein
MKSALSAFVVLVLAPSAAFACPMCFTGNNSNQSAFLYGSLFLMAVPVIAIGSLVYWAYRRIRAAELAQQVVPPAATPDGPEGQSRTPLRLVRR